MSIQFLVQIIHSPNMNEWTEQNKQAFRGLFDSDDRRYPKSLEKLLAVRAPAMNLETGVPFAAYIHPANPGSGAYGGTSFVIFPTNESASLIGLVVGTQGLAPDEAILGRPGHARKAQAICAWLNHEFGNGDQVAWAKQDPTRTDITVPEALRRKWSQYKGVFDRYGKELYALYKPNEDENATEQAVCAFLDLLVQERGEEPLANKKKSAEDIRAKWFSHLMPELQGSFVHKLLMDRRFVVIQGPPGTGKTRMAIQLRDTEFNGNGRSIQFHPNTTYEGFVGGLAPVQSSGELGLQFRPTPGFLMEAVLDAAKDPSKPYLLHIDEINRADLSKVLGEAIFLFEAKTDEERVINLQYDFGAPVGRSLGLPRNLFVLGTMNSADRSIAIVDVAVRRRFAFVSLWPQMGVVEKNGCELMQKRFRDLVSIFVEHAPEDAFHLMPGHSYFLEEDETDARRGLKTSLAPLLEEYLAQGYVSGFAEPIRTYLQEIRSL